jgi:hypothetical protein
MVTCDDNADTHKDYTSRFHWREDREGLLEGESAAAWHAE